MTSSSSDDEDISSLRQSLAESPRRRLSPGRQRDAMSLSRISFTPGVYSIYIYRVSHGSWPSDIERKRRYKLERIFSQYEWRVRILRANRFVPRFLDDNEIDDAHSKDGEEESEESGGDDLVGTAVDESNDARRERVLFVRMQTRNRSDVDKNGRRLLLLKWIEVVPTSKIDAVLSSMWHPQSSLALTVSKLYNTVIESYVGISADAVRRWLAKQSTAQLSKSTAVADKMLAPSLPSRLGQLWSCDVTFTDGTMPSAPYVGWLTVIDCLSRFAWTEAVRDKSAPTLAAIIEDLFLKNGPPESLLMDSAFEFKSSTMRLVCQRHGVRMRFATPYKSQENGIVERDHGTLKGLVRRTLIDAQRAGQSLNFAIVLESATRQYNVTEHAVIGLPPYTIQHGRDPPKSLPLVLLREGTGTGAGAGAGSGVGLQQTRGNGSLVTKTLMGRSGRSEVRDLIEGQQQQERYPQRSSRAGSLPAPSQQSAARSRAGPLETRMKPQEAAARRIGVATSVASSFGRRESVALPAPLNPSAKYKIRSVLAVVFDSIGKRMLYGIRYAPPLDDPAYDNFIPASFIGTTDPKLQQWIRDSVVQDKFPAPVVFEREFVGEPTVDRSRPIPFNAIVSDVESGLDDGQDGGSVIDADDSGSQEIVEREGDDEEDDGVAQKQRMGQLARNIGRDRI